MRTSQRPTHLVAGLLLGVLTIGTSLAASAAETVTIPAGYDLFETDPQETHFDFQIPAGFFGPGSEPFTNRVKFAGVPLETFMGHPVGDADTVVQRAAAAPEVPVPIELVALSLVSMEPITVTYHGGGAERWDVGVGLSPSQPSVGHMVIHEGGLTNPGGGTFDSELQVVPLFTFTRLSDGETLLFDGVSLPPQVLVASGVPWRDGCVLPALAVPGLNDGFCPSFDGAKQLTIEEALLATHGIRPAQPALEHFKCYTLGSRPFPDRSVALTDQFGTRQADVLDRARLCNPARKQREPWSNRRAHLVCYTAPGPTVDTAVVVRNQFGSQRLAVHQAETLCVPSRKREMDQSFRAIQVPIDHFQCYAVEPLTPLLRQGGLGPVRLTDQFGAETVQVGRAIQLCTPVDKDGSQIQHPVSHLVCYRITGANASLGVEVKNQFERRELVVRSARSLCVPSTKVVIPN